jgi:hypothetical protein
MAIKQKARQSAALYSVQYRQIDAYKIAILPAFYLPRPEFYTLRVYDATRKPNQGEQNVKVTEIADDALSVGYRVFKRSGGCL